MIKKIGQISIIVALIGAAGTISVSLITAWVTASVNLYGVKQDVAVIEEREKNHYKEIERRLGGIEGKIDQLINQNHE